MFFYQTYVKYLKMKKKFLTFEMKNILLFEIEKHLPFRNEKKITMIEKTSSYL